MLLSNVRFHIKVVDKNMRCAADYYMMSAHTRQDQSNEKMQTDANLDKYVVPLWEKIQFRFSSGKQTFDLAKVLISERLNISKVQYAVTFNKDFTVEVLKDRFIELFDDENNGVLDVIVENQETHESEILKNIEDIFEKSILDKVESIELDSQKRKQALKTLQTKIPSSIRSGKCQFYECDIHKSLFLVGEPNYLHQTLEEFDLNIPAVPPRENRRVQIKKEITLKESILLHYLGFENYLRGKYPEIMVNVTQKPPCCEFSQKGHGLVNLDMEIETFLNKLQRERIILKDPLCYKLLCDQDGCPNDSVHSFIKDKWKQKMHGTTTFCVIAEEDTYYVYCENKATAADMAKIIQDNIIFCRYTTVSDHRWKFINDNSDKKLVFKKLSDDLVHISYTSDIHYQFTEEMGKKSSENVQRFKVPKYVLEFLTRDGQSLILSIKQKYDADVNFQDDELIVKCNSGIRNDAVAQQILADIQRLCSSVKVTVPICCIEKNKNEIEQELRKVQCGWVLQQDIVPVNGLDHCKYIASWIDPLHVQRPVVTVVEGFPWHIDFGLHLVFTNQCLFPLEVSDLPIEVTPFKTFLDVCREDRKNKGLQDTLALGECTCFVKNAKTSDESQIIGLTVYTSSVRGTRGQISDQQMIREIKEILKKCLSEKIRTVGINAKVVKIDNLDLISNTLNAVADFLKETPHSTIEELVLCSFKNEKEVVLKVDNFFKDNRGILRREYFNEDCLSKRQAVQAKELQVQVKRMPIQDSDTDIIVNTTKQDLDLKKGMVSEQLLETAGECMQEELRKKYPNGLSNGQVAVSTRFKKRLRFKRIYHIALSAYSRDFFVEEVKMYVQKCLCQADKDKCLSISFPAFGMGKLRYPRRETAAAMFEAVSEYFEEVIDSRIQKVIFAVHELDIEACKAFENEHWRRNTPSGIDYEITKSLVKTEFEALHVDLYKGSLSVQIATLDSFGLPPSYAVQIGFGKGSRKFKEAKTSPGTWNDRYIIDAAFGNSAELSESLKKCLHDLNKERTTMLVIYTSCEMKLSIGNQAKIIVDTLNCYKINFLEEVVIVVPDESGLANVQAKLQLQKATRLPKTVSKQTQITKLKLIGLNAENVAGARKSISRLMSRIYTENQDVVLKESCSDASHQSISKDSKKNKVEGEPLQHTDEVSAEINSGLIVCLDKSQILQTWIGKVELVFRIKIITEKQKVSVVGDFESILRFEKYLETEFPKYPDECCLDRTDESSLNETNEKYSSFELSADKCEESPIEIDRYMVGNVRITLQTQAIQKTPSKCIAIPCCDCSTKAKNILNQLEIVRIPPLETAVEKEEPLKPLECRFFENTFGIPEVVLIYIPPYSDRGVYKNALAKMFQEVTDKNLDSVMLYLLNPEETDCPDKDYLDAYAQSIHQIAKSNTCLREIAVVNSDQSLLKAAKCTFDHKLLDLDKTLSAPSSTDTQKRNLENVGVIISGSKSSLYVAKGKLFEETCQVLVCFVNEKFEYIGPDGPKLHELAPDSYKRNYNNELKKSHWKQAVEIPCTGGNLQSHYVIHVIMEASRRTLTIRQKIQLAMIQAQEKNMRSVAIPVLRTDNFDDNPKICEETIHGVIEACRTAQLREQEMRIHILATDDKSLDTLIAVTNKSLKIVTHGQTKNIE